MSYSKSSSKENSRATLFPWLAHCLFKVEVIMPILHKLFCKIKDNHTSTHFIEHQNITMPATPPHTERTSLVQYN